MLKTKLAGMHLPLQDAVARTIEEARERMKLAASEKDGDEKAKVKKLVAYEKKEHGHVPSEEEEKKEKCSSVIDIHDAEEVEKLAAALDFAAEKLAGDGVDLGKEHAQGGQVLAVMKPVGGTQPYKKDSSKSHNVPTSTGKDSKPPDQTAAGEIVPTDLKKTPGGKGAKYPPNGVLRKTGSVAVLQAAAEKLAAKGESKGEIERGERIRQARGAGRIGAGIYGAAGGIAGAGAGHKKWGKKGAVGGGVAGALGGAAAGYGAGYVQQRLAGKLMSVAGGKGKDKKSSAEAVDYILGKIATELGGEHKQGGETLPNTAPVPSNPGRQLISSNAAPKGATKREAKAPRKKELAEVLTEPALSAAHDSKVNENLPKANAGKVSKIAQDLRSATKGGVKTAAARALLAKIAEEGCKCDGKGTCRHCKLKTSASKMVAGETQTVTV